MIVFMYKLFLCRLFACKVKKANAKQCANLHREGNRTEHNTDSLIDSMTDGRSYNLQYYNPVKYIDYNAVSLQ